jgi:hypothetical protein
VTVANCPGSGNVGNIVEEHDWCRACGGIYRVRNDGTLRRHPMDWARMVRFAAQVVRDYEIATGRWLP